MKKIKDFIYDYNDVLVALLIVAVAGFIIFWRVNVVMSYADVAEVGDVQQIDIDFSNIDLNQEQVDDVKTPEPEVGEDVQEEQQEEPEQQPEQQEEQPQQQPEQQPEQQPQQETPKVEVKKYSLEVSKKANTTNWTAVGKKLQDNGVITDYKTFVARVVARKVESNLQLGTFEITSAMTTDEIIDLLIKK